MVAVAAAGAWAYLTLGRAEDPPFTIKQMVIQTQWPGASADQMARLVVDRIERKLEELPSLDHAGQHGAAGPAYITVNLRDDTPPASVPDLWYQVRKKIGDIAPTLPPACRARISTTSSATSSASSTPSPARASPCRTAPRAGGRARASCCRCRGVGKISIVGDQEERLYIEFSYRKLAELGLSVADVIAVVRARTRSRPAASPTRTHDRIYRAHRRRAGWRGRRCAPCRSRRVAAG